MYLIEYVDRVAPAPNFDPQVINLIYTNISSSKPQTLYRGGSTQGQVLYDSEYDGC